MWRTILIAAVAAGCGGPPLEHPMASSPLLAAEWPVLEGPGPRSDAEGADEGDDKGDEEEGQAQAAGGDLRDRMVAAARRWLGDGAERPEQGYGARDVEDILSRVMPGLAWDAASGLESLVSVAKEREAFRSEGKPRPGDVALFHNQQDVNANGAADDWLTGCAVVVDGDGPRFKAVTRTGRAPREIVVWPDGPSVEVLDGEKVNSYLRIPSRADPEDAEYLAGDLYAGYVDIEALEASGGAR